MFIGCLAPLLVAGPAHTPPPRVFRVEAEGKGDASAAIRSAIARARDSGPGAVVELGPGTFRVSAPTPRAYCFSVAGARGLTIRGQGRATRLVVTEPDAGLFLISDGSDVALTDLSVDYDPLPFTQGVVRQVSVEEGWFDLEIDPGYSTPDSRNFVEAAEPYGKWGMIIDPRLRRIRSGTSDHFMTPRWERRSGRTWRFFTNGEHYRLALRDMRPGDRYVHLARGYGGAVLAQGCDGIRIENVTVHASPGLAVGLVGNRGSIRVRRLQVRFPAGHDRLLTTNADGVHCQQNRSGPIIEACHFEGMADDAINIYAPPNILLERRTPTEWLLSAGCRIVQGDRLQVLDPRSGRVRGLVRATNVALAGDRYRVTLDHALDGAVAGPDHRTGDTLYNLDACGAGFRIIGNEMIGHRRYGCLLRAPDGLVEGNTFADTTGAGVAILNEPDWPEGPMPGAITVRNNRFLRGGTCRGYADGAHGQILVRSTALGNSTASEAGIDGIVIAGNAFEGYLGVAVRLEAVRHVSIRDNRFRGGRYAMVRGAPIIELIGTSEAVLTGNTLTDRRAEVACGVLVVGAGATVEVAEQTTSLRPGIEAVVRRP